MHRSLCLILFLLPILNSCADKYHAFKSNYQFKSEDGKPRYQNLNYWAAHPGKWDPSDSVPAPLKAEPMTIGRIDSSVDVFFLYPTSFTKNKDRHIANASIDDEYINAKTDYSSILYQASVFNEQCRVFAPRYRQGPDGTCNASSPGPSPPAAPPCRQWRSPAPRLGLVRAGATRAWKRSWAGRKSSGKYCRGLK